MFILQDGSIPKATSSMLIKHHHNHTRLLPCMNIFFFLQHKLLLFIILSSIIFSFFDLAMITGSEISSSLFLSKTHHQQHQVTTRTNTLATNKRLSAQKQHIHSAQDRAPKNWEDFVFDHTWRGFLDDDAQSYESEIFTIKLDNTTNSVDVHILKTSDYEHSIRQYPIFIHLTGKYEIQKNLTTQFDFIVNQLSCENLLLPNGLMDPSGCKTYSELWTPEKNYSYSLYDVDEDGENLNFYWSIEYSMPDKQFPVFWKGLVYPVDRFSSCSFSSSMWRMDRMDIFPNFAQNAFLRLADQTFVLQVNQNIDYSTARTICKLQDNFLSLNISGKYSMIPELGIMVATKSTCEDLQFWVQDITDCNLCPKIGRAFGLTSLVFFGVQNQGCNTIKLQAEQTGNTMQGYRIQNVETPKPKQWVNPIICDNNHNVIIAVSVSVISGIMIAIISFGICTWCFFWRKNRRPAYRPLE